MQSENVVANQLANAAYRNDFDTVKKLIETGANPNLFDPKSLPAITCSCYHPNSKILAHLLEHGADPNIYTTDRKSALKTAAKNKNIFNIKMLLEHGADPNYENGSGDVALYVFFDDDQEYSDDDCILSSEKEILDLLVPVTHEKYLQKVYECLRHPTLRDHLKQLTPHINYVDPAQFGGRQYLYELERQKKIAKHPFLERYLEFFDRYVDFYMKQNEKSDPNYIFALCLSKSFLEKDFEEDWIEDGKLVEEYRYYNSGYFNIPLLNKDHNDPKYDQLKEEFSDVFSFFKN